MKCPLLSNPREGYVTLGDCFREKCQAWEVKAKYNPETKEYEGDCRLFMLDRKISGLIGTHPA